jgi:hypothetical protein
LIFTYQSNRQHAQENPFWHQQFLDAPLRL